MEEIIINVLSNDVFEGAVTVTITTPPTAPNTAVVQPNNTIVYTHVAANNDDDSFVYQIDDGNTTDTATVVMKAAPTGGGSLGTQFNISMNSYYNPATNGEGACEFALDDTKYHGGAFVNPTLGDIIYTDVNKTNIFNGGDKYYAISGGISIRIASYGEVVGYWICGAGEA